LKFTELAWSAVLYYYRSTGDKKYVKLFSDTQFLSDLRYKPSDISEEDFKTKVIIGFISDIGIRPLVSQERELLEGIKKLHKALSSVGDVDLLSCDLSDENIIENIKQIYEWQKLNPEYCDPSSKCSDTYQKMLFQVMNGDTIEESNENINKIIKNIAKETIDQKNIKFPVIPSTKDDLYKDYGLGLMVPEAVKQVRKKVKAAFAAGIEHGEYEGWEKQCPGQFVIGTDGNIIHAEKGWLDIDMIIEALQ